MQRDCRIASAIFGYQCFYKILQKNIRKYLEVKKKKYYLCSPFALKTDKDVFIEIDMRSLVEKLRD